MDLSTYLDENEANYSPEYNMLGQVWHGPGYHTRIPNGTWVHPTRTALDYALALLRSGDPAHQERAADVIAAVLALQDTDPVGATYGIWPWLREESLAEMAPPDWNWADFCGIRLALILADHAQTLPQDLIAEIRHSLGHAAWSIFRRNVRPGYTNIAIMGAGVALAAGELLQEARLVDYGRRRLQRVVDHTEFHGGFNEYNSPTYTVVVIHECENILHLVADAAARSAAEILHRQAWQTLADHFHPGTGQWAGPHSRTYTDRLPSNLCAYLSQQTGVAITPHPQAPVRGAELPAPHHLPCPADLAPRFRSLPQPETVVERQFLQGSDKESTVRGITWLAVDACLGTVNHDCFWTQRRPLLGYWCTAHDPAVVLRLRFLKDGQDFASVYVRNVQQGPRVLSAVTLLTDRGDTHLSLDKPADGIFEGTDLRLRCELTGTGVVARQLAAQVYELAAGGYRAVIHTGDGRFGGDEIRWQLGQSAGDEAEGQVFLDAVCYSGPRRGFDLAAVGEVILAAGLELIAADAPISQSAVTVDPSGPDAMTAHWAAVDGSISVPVQAHRYPLV